MKDLKANILEYQDEPIMNIVYQNDENEAQSFQVMLSCTWREQAPGLQIIL